MRGLAAGVEHGGDAADRGAQLGDGGHVGGVADVDVRDLVVGDGERPRRPRVEVLHAVLGVHAQQALGAQGAVDVHGAGDVGDAVLRQHHHGPLPGGVQQRRQHAVQLGGRGGAARVAGAVALQVVVEVRQVGEGEVGVAGGHDVPSGTGDPPRGGQAGARPPVGEQGERAELGGELVVQLGRVGVAVGVLAAVGAVDGPRGDRPVDVGAHGVPPAHVGDRVPGPGGVPQLLPADQGVVLAPEQHLAEVAEVPAVADDPVAGRGQPGEERGLDRAGDGGQDGAELRLEALGGDGAQAGHVREQPRGEPDHVQDQQFRHPVTPSSRSSVRANSSSAAMPAARSAAVAGRRAGGSTLQV